MSEIRTENGKLIVPDNPDIVFIEGDGIGKEITGAMIEIVDSAVNSSYRNRKINWKEEVAGGKAVELTGSNLPEKTLESIRKSLVAIKGPLMTPVGTGARSINVALRQSLDLYACVRPIEYIEGVPSPVRHPEKVDMVVFRENTEDIYAGIEWASGSDDAGKVISFLSEEMGVKKIRFPGTSAIGIKPVSVEGSKRLIRAAIEYAIRFKRKSVTLVHKGNIMKFTEGGFRKWGYEVAKEEFGATEKEGRIFIGDIEIKDVITDAFLQNILIKPENYDVIATMNLNGDYISDALAAQVGGIGIAPGANINYITGHAVFEATHGTAPDIAGKGIANPLSIVLSACMMLEYIGWDDASSIIRKSISKSIGMGYVTKDLYDLFAKDGVRAELLGTREFKDNLISLMGE